MAPSSPRKSDRQPLLKQRPLPQSSMPSYGSSPSTSLLADDEETPGSDAPLDRSVENDVLPETAIVGRNLGWVSAYMLIMSRVFGSGIFATPGTIVRSVGSIGITLILWVIGALLSWFGLAVTLEYGCMLPRSGGKHHWKRCGRAQAEQRKVTRSTSNLFIGVLDFWRQSSSPYSQYSLDLRHRIVSSLANTSCLLWNKSLRQLN